MKNSGHRVSPLSISRSFIRSTAPHPGFCRLRRLAGLLLLVLLALPAGAAQVIPSAVPAAAQGLTPLTRASADQQLNLVLALPLRNTNELARLLRQIYDPASPSFHQYLTPTEFAERFGPTEADYDAVVAFARDHRLAITATTPNRLLLDVRGSVADVEAALHVTFWNFQHPTEARTFFAPTSDPSLDLGVPLLRIGGLNNFALPRPRHVVHDHSKANWANPNAGSGPSGTFMGYDFRSAYVPGSSLNGSGQSVGLLQFDGYTASDITYYETLAGLPAVTLTNVLLDGFDGTPSGGGGEVEVSLDIEMAISMAPGLSQVIVYEAGPYGSWYDILNRMTTDNLAKQLSCSWYIPNGPADPVADQIFLEMAAQGQSFFNASGDSDAYAGAIDFPGDTPYITQVGGTTLTTSGPAGEWVSETVWNWGNGVGSGGGISTYYSIPDWQTNVDMTASLGSSTMRNTPDVALTADNVYVRADGLDHDVGGTSCAAPLWAGFTALINQQAAATGRQPIGFINPLVYALGGQSDYTNAFHDIATGNNTSAISPTRFYAVPGYDLCTGWGTPAGQKLIDTLEPLVFVILPASATEGAGLLAGAAEVQIPSVPSTNVIVQLSSSDPSQVQVPATVTVLAGQTNATFDLTILDDGLLKGTQTASISAVVPGYGSGIGKMQVFDAETATLSVSLPATATEGQAPLQGQVLISAPPAVDVNVALSSSSPQDIQVPATITIPAGLTSAPFTALAVTNNKLQAPLMVTVTAHVPNWTDGSAGILVYSTNSWALTLNLPASTWENYGVLTNAGRLSLSGVVATDLAVSLASGNSSKLTVPPVITVPAGSTSATFDLTLVDNTIADGHQTVSVTASAPNFTNGSAAIYIMDDESPPPPSNPRPGDFATGVPANTNLSWSSGLSSELMSNGDFELGSLTNWTQAPSSVGHFVINNGSFNPPSPDGALPPFAGSFDAVGEETGPGAFSMYQDVVIPAGASLASLSWAHRVRNFYTSFTNSQIFQVRICTTNNVVLATAFTTKPGDPLLGDWVQTSYDLTQYAGQKVRVMFWVYPGSYYLDVHLDNVSLLVDSGANQVTNDVYFGTHPVPGPADLQGSTTGSSWALPLLAPQTTYYWQIVAHRVGVAAGPIWRFTTRGVDHFAWDSIASPQVVNQPFSVAITARDSFEQTVTNFTGSVAITGQLGGSAPVKTIEDFESGVWPHSPWVLLTSTVPGTLGTAYAHDGKYGLLDPEWMYRTDVSLGQANDTITCWMRPSSATTGRAYFGFGASASGCFSLVAAPNTSQLLIQRNAGYGFLNVASNAQTFQANKWYKLAVHCVSPSTITGTLYDSDGATVLNSVSYTNVTGLPGGVALRSFGFSIDTVLSDSSAGSFPITPTNSTSFVSGHWTGTLTGLALGTNVTLTADDGNSHVGLSNPFDVAVLNDLSLNMLDSPDPVSVGANLTYTLTVANAGPNSATSVMLTNLLAPQVSFVSAVASQGTCAQSGGQVTADLGTIPGGANAVVTIVCSPNLAGTTVSNWATVSRGETDPYLANNSASAITTVTLPAIAIADTSVVEGNAGTTTLLFPVSLASPSSQTISVNFSTTNGTATAGSDYLPTNGVLQFSPGITNATIAVTVLGDTTIEPDETLLVNLSNPSNAVLGRSQAVGTILNDDGLPGHVDHFAWSPIASPQYMNTPWDVTITAKDYFNATVTNFTGTVFLQGASTNAIGVNTDFEAGTLDPWVPLYLGVSPGPYLLTNYDVNGDGISSTAFKIASNSGTPDGITQNVQLLGGSTYQVGMDIAAVNENSGNNADGGTVAILIGTTTVAQYSFGAIDNNQVFRYHLQGSFTAPSSGTYPVALTFYRAYLEPGGLWNLADDLTIVGSGYTLTLTPGVSGNFVQGSWTGPVTVMSHATNATLRADDGAGHYGMSNPFDVVPGNMAPILLTQPTNLTLIVGSTATLSVSADGTPPLIYQWYCNSNAVDQATNASLTFTNVPLSRTGTYYVVVTNVFGSIQSSNAVLMVTSHPPVAVPDTIAFLVGTPVLSFNVLTNDSDVDGDPLTVLSFTLPSRGTLTQVANGLFSYQPNPDFVSGQDQFSYTIGDGTGGTSSAQVVINAYTGYLNGGDWTTFGNGPSHTGYYPGILGGSTFVPGWSTNYGVALNQVAVAANKVYVTPVTYFGATYLEARDAVSGQLAWHLDFTSAFSINPPTFYQGSVYVQRGDHAADTQLWRINAADGSVVWSSPHAAQWERYYAPTIFGNGIWVDGGYYGGMYGFDTNGNQLFFYANLQQYDQWTPTYYQGTVYSWVAGEFGAHDPLTGSLLWKTTTSWNWDGWSMNTVSAIDDGMAFVQQRPNLIGIDLTTHSNAWTTTVGMTGSPAVAKGVVYAIFGDQVRTFAARSGASLGTYQATNDSGLFWQPIVTDDALFISSSLNTYVFDLNSHQLLQKIPYGGTLSLANGRLYIAGQDGWLRSYYLAPPPCVKPLPGLVGWWQAESNALDSAGTNHGIDTGTSYYPGKVGSAFLLDGQTASIRIPASPSLDVGQGFGLTLEAWINPLSTATEEPIAEWSSGSLTYGTRLWISMPPPEGTGAGCLYANLRDTSDTDHILCSAPGLVQPGVFQHVAVTYDATTGWACLFLNGLVVTQQNLGLFTPQTSSDLYLGARTTGTTAFWYGSLDEVSLYDHALATNEVHDIFAASSGGKCRLPPTIVVPPVRDLVRTGCASTFHVVAVGPQPLSYQWWKDGAPLDAETNSNLSIADVELGDFGAYSVVVTNGFGSVTSAPVLLSLDQIPMGNPDEITRFAAGGVRINASVLTANDTDGDGDGLSVVAVSSNSTAGGTVRLDGNWIYYTPPDPGLLVDYFTYTVSDGHCGGLMTGGGVTVRIKPDDPQPTTFGMENAGNGSVQMKFDGVPGWTYHILYCEDLANPVWQVLATGTADNSGVVTVSDTSTNAPKRYYRAVYP